MSTPLFTTSSIYQIGPIHKCKHYTPFNSSHFPELTSINTPHYYPTYNQKIIYTNLIFNSYVITVEEQFCTLFAADGKLTIVNTLIERNVLYTFKIESENEYVRVAKVYQFECESSVGYISIGRVRKYKIEERKKSKNAKGYTRNENKVDKTDETRKISIEDNKIIGFDNQKLKKGQYMPREFRYKIVVNNKEYDLLPIRNYMQDEEIRVMMIQKEIGVENGILYREINCFDKRIIDDGFKEKKVESEFFYAVVEKDLGKMYVCKGGYLRGMLYKESLNREIKIGEIIKVKILKENNFKFIFTIENVEFETISPRGYYFYKDKHKKKSLNNNNKDKTNKNFEDVIQENELEFKQGFVKKHNSYTKDNFNLCDGMITEATVRNIHKVHGTFVKVNNFIGVMKKSETSKNYIEDISRYLMGKTKLKGVLYNVNKEERSFMFSVRKYEMLDLDLDDGVELSCPFSEEILNKKVIDKENKINDFMQEKIKRKIFSGSDNTNHILADENMKRVKINDLLVENQNQLDINNKGDQISLPSIYNKELNNDTVNKLPFEGQFSYTYNNQITNSKDDNNDIKNNTDNYIKNDTDNDLHNTNNLVIENENIIERIKDVVKNKQKNKESYDDIKEYIESIIQNSHINIREDIIIFLIEVTIKSQEDIYSIIKKYNKITTENIFTRTINNINENDDKIKILKLYYKKYPNANSYKNLLEFYLVNKVEEAAIYKDKTMLCIAIDLFYKIVANEARVRTEKILFKDIKLWRTYIDHEIKNIEYCRGLFRRVVKLEWTFEETKEWFKKWLEFEKKNQGNSDEVKNKAIEYVENYKKANA
ncbi:rRNA biogenesis protein rrp5 [Conglomerata obtusa]